MGQFSQTVYPRSRGEHAIFFLPPLSKNGLSPLTRGTQRKFSYFRWVHRFIPARAGNTGGSNTTTGKLAVYPRSRGEHSSRICGSGHLYGLSPLARGTLLCCVECNQCERFIPARAGNTAGYNPPFMTTSVYPRSRGEHSVASSTSNVRDGLSPLARGTPKAASSSAVGSPVYPRSRGEHRIVRIAGIKIIGLSPLARGTRCYHDN